MKTVWQNSDSHRKGFSAGFAEIIETTDMTQCKGNKFCRTRKSRNGDPTFGRGKPSCCARERPKNNNMHAKMLENPLNAHLLPKSQSSQPSCSHLRRDLFINFHVVLHHCFKSNKAPIYIEGQSILLNPSKLNS